MCVCFIHCIPSAWYMVVNQQMFVEQIGGCFSRCPSTCIFMFWVFYFCRGDPGSEVVLTNVHIDLFLIFIINSRLLSQESVAIHAHCPACAGCSGS